MRIKLDENMPLSLAALLRSAGHNVSTVPEENLSGDDGGLRVQMLLDNGRHKGAVDDRRFDSLFELRWDFLSFNIQASFMIYSLFKLFDREQLSRIAVN